MPVNRLMPLLQFQFPDRTIMTKTIADETALQKGLHDEPLDLAVLTAPPEALAIFRQRYLREKLFLCVTPDHPLAKNPLSPWRTSPPAAS
jgi:DNA-binding transcriptional LysR family regulator